MNTQACLEQAIFRWTRPIRIAALRIAVGRPPLPASFAACMWPAARIAGRLNGRVGSATNFEELIR